MIVLKNGERVFADPEEESRWWGLVLQENQLDLDLQFTKKTPLQASDGYFVLALAAGQLGFDEDAKRLLEKVSPQYDPLLSPNPLVRLISGISAIGRGERGSKN